MKPVVSLCPARFLGPGELMLVPCHFLGFCSRCLYPDGILLRSYSQSGSILRTPRPSCRCYIGRVQVVALSIQQQCGCLGLVSSPITVNAVLRQSQAPVCIVKRDRYSCARLQSYPQFMGSLLGISQVEALGLAVGAAQRRVSMADAFTGTTPRASRDIAGSTEVPWSSNPPGPLSDESFLEHPRTIVLQSQLSILRRTVNALQKCAARSFPVGRALCECSSP